jgi:hypothetical protein
MYVVPEWVERHCTVPDGFRRGAPFRLYNYQLTWYAAFYLVRGDAVWVPANPILAPAFVNRRGLLVGPQKLGKNPLIATHVCVEGAGPALFAGFAGVDEGYVCAEHGCRCGWEYAYDVGEPKGMSWPTPLIQITAFSEDSTENTYDALRPMIELGPLADLIPKTGEEFIRLPGGGRIDTVTSSNQSRLGQRITFAPQDELGLWTAANKMVKLADTQYRNLSGMGGRAALTSNAWDPAENSVAQLQFESPARDIHRQFTQPPKNLSYGNKADRRKIHRIVYPADVLAENGGHLPIAAIEAEAADLAERDLAQAARFYGNILMSGGGAAVDVETWARLMQPQDVPPGTHIGLGFDGSISRDATALIACTRTGYAWPIQIWERPRDAPEGWRIPRLEVKAAVERAFHTYRVGLMLADPPKWPTEIEEWAQTYELGPKPEQQRVLAFDTNQPRRMAPAVDRLLTAIRESAAIKPGSDVARPFTHSGDEALTRHVMAATLTKVRLAADENDGRSMYLIDKGEQRAWIDGAIALVLAFQAAMTMSEPPAKKGGWAFIG